MTAASTATSDPSTSPDEAPLIAPPPRTVTAELEGLFQQIGQVASFPSIAREVLEVANTEDCSAADLLEVVEQDPVLALKILQTVNSSYYGLANEVADLGRAIAMLGVTQVRNMALTVIVGRHFARPSDSGAIEPEQLWDHSVCTAAAARILAQKTGVVDSDEAYLAGLIHDSGLLFIDQKLDHLMPKVIQRFQETHLWMEAEKEVLNFDHAQLGAYVAWRSGFPHRLVAAVDYHHCPTEADDDVAPLAGTVAVANYLVSRLGRITMPGRRLAPPLEVVFERLGLSQREVRALWPELETMLANIGGLKQV